MNSSPLDDAHRYLETHGSRINDHHDGSECADDLEYVNGARVPIVEAERVHYKDFDVLCWFCVICDKFHGQAPREGYAQGNCFIIECPYWETGVNLREVAKVAPPERRHKPKYLRDGRLISGYLYAQERARRR